MYENRLNIISAQFRFGLSHLKVYRVRFPPDNLVLSYSTPRRSYPARQPYVWHPDLDIRSLDPGLSITAARRFHDLQYHTGIIVSESSDDYLKETVKIDDDWAFDRSLQKTEVDRQVILY